MIQELLDYCGGAIPGTERAVVVVGSKVWLGPAGTSVPLTEINALLAAQDKMTAERYEPVVKECEAVLSTFLDLTLSTMTSDQTHALSHCRSLAITARKHALSLLPVGGEDSDREEAEL